MTTVVSEWRRRYINGLDLMKRFLTPGDRLSQRIMQAGFWVLALRITDRLFSLARTVLLARLLAPNDFGLFGITMLALSAIETLSETGFYTALIQRNGDIRPYLDTAWTVQAIRGFVLAAILILLAPYVASFFNEPGAASLVRALALYEAFSGLINTGVIYFQKNLEFHKQFIYMFSGTLVNLLVAIPAALILRNAWALVFGLVAGQFMKMVVSYLVHPYRPRPRWERANTQELFSFGRWIFIGSVLGFLALNGHNIFVGKVLGAAALGLYQMAFMLSNSVVTEITCIVSQVAFPTFCKLQNETKKLKKVFFMTFEIVSAIALPMTGGIIVLGPTFISLFLGERWIAMVPVMRFLALSGLVLSLTAVGGPLFWGVGKPNISFWMNAVRVTVMFASIYPLTMFFGLTGASLAVLLGLTSNLPIFLHASLNIVCAPFSDLWRKFWPPLSASMVSNLLVLVVAENISKSSILVFFLMIALWLLSYLLIVYGLWKILKVGPISLLYVFKETRWW